MEGPEKNAFHNFSEIFTTDRFINRVINIKYIWKYKNNFFSFLLFTYWLKVLIELLKLLALLSLLALLT